jgi:hypothetical protein
MLSGKTLYPVVVFSSLNGRVWASWPGTDASVDLGPLDDVTEMMRDFLAQRELGERLAQRDGTND